MSTTFAGDDTASGASATIGFSAITDSSLRADCLPLFFKSSAKRTNQLLIEQKLSTLHSPAWSKSLPAVDAKKVAAGAKLYSENCVSCHAITPRNQPLSPIAVTVAGYTRPSVHFTCTRAPGWGWGNWFIAGSTAYPHASPERATDAEQPCAVQQGAISMGVRPGRARPERHTNGGGR